MDFNFAFQPGGLDRAAPLRTDASVRANPEARTNLFWRGKLLVEGSDHPARIPLDHPALVDCREPPAFVGLADGIPLFAADLSLWQPHEDAAVIGQFTDTTSQIHPGFEGCRFAEIRGLMPTLTLLEGEAVATGRALLSWHATHRFCANCGTASTPEASGWHRKCPSCGTQHFPRTDPVVIMLAEHEGRALVGRQPQFPPGRYSALAGFLEVGESLEEAVARELFEEAGVRAMQVRYLASQPWPIISSQLMLACIATVESDALTIDRNELDDVRWVDRDGVLAALAGASDAPFIPPPPYAIAHELLTRWARGE